LENYPATIDKITNDDIHSIRKDYSTYLLKELEDEVLAKYRDFPKYLDILRDIHDITFSRTTFFASYTKIKEAYGIDETESVIIERLFEFGIIGFLKSGGGGLNTVFAMMKLDKALIQNRKRLKHIMDLKNTLKWWGIESFPCPRLALRAFGTHWFVKSV
jgi:hypothetical protein